jgi:hypothetical protein
MAKTRISTPYTQQAFEKHVDPQFKALLSQSILNSDSGENPHEIFNQLLKEQHGLRLYKSGQTSLPNNKAYSLYIEAERRIRHSAKLWRNMRSADPKLEKSSEYESHHIVAARIAAAETSRKIMFAANIGINDARNGVNIHKLRHKELHRTDTEYYSVVNFRMLGVMGENEQTVGEELVDIGQDIEDRIL